MMILAVLHNERYHEKNVTIRFDVRCYNVDPQVLYMFFRNYSEVIFVIRGKFTKICKNHRKNYNRTLLLP